jgi:N-acetylmuramoyl-L-alanine amidase
MMMKNDDELIKRTTILCSVFSVVAIGVMTIFFLFREVPANANTLVNSDTSIMIKGGMLKQTEYLCIPLPKTITKEEIEISNSLMESRTSIMIEGVEEDFFYHNPLSGSSSHIVHLKYGYGNGMARLDLLLDGFYETQSVFEDNKLYIKFSAPKELYEGVVVVDPGHGGIQTGTVAFGQTEKDITLKIANSLKEKMKDSNIKLYLTRTTDEEQPSMIQRIDFANKISADMFISIHCNADVKTRITNGIQICYSNEFFIPNFNSEDLARNLQNSLVKNTNAKDRGVDLENKLEILTSANIPAVLINAGYLTNKQEALKLSEEKYIEKIAEGIYEGIIKSYKEMDKIDDEINK